MVSAKSAKQKVSVSTSAKSVAEALVKHFPKDADRIVKVMGDAATSRSMKRKLARTQLALEALRQAK
jgi:hypothetical protein